LREYNKNISSESISERKPWNWKINSNKLKALNIVKKKAKLSNIKKISNTTNKNENLNNEDTNILLDESTKSENLEDEEEDFDIPSIE
jgi:hypothetical protein